MLLSRANSTIRGYYAPAPTTAHAVWLQKAGDVISGSDGDGRGVHGGQNPIEAAVAR